MRYDSNTIPVCQECVALEALPLKACARCGVEFCSHHASLTDVRYCGNCLSDFKVVENQVIKTVEHLNDRDEVVRKRTYMATQFKLEGTDWLFAAGKILEMDEATLSSTIEYHRHMVSLFLTERENRRVERAHKLAQIKVVNIKRQSQYEKERAAEVKATSKAKTRSTTKTKSKDLTETDLEKLLKTLKNAGITPEMLSKLGG